MNRITNLHEDWKTALSDLTFVLQAILTIIISVLVLFHTMMFFEYVQARPGEHLNDLLLNRIPSHNLSVYTFTLLYSSILFTLFQLLKRPRQLVQAIQMYILIILLRILTIYLLPLEPPDEMIPLKDPLIDFFIYQNKMISKDLFFSGHVSTVFLAALIVEGRWQKGILIVATISVAIMILLQHVHYTIDVLAAPVFTFISYAVVKKVYQFFGMDKKLKA